MTQMTARRGCDIAGCPNKHKGHGLCEKHLERLKRTGTTDDPKRPTFEERFWAKVGRRGPDECWPWTSAVNEHGYGVIHPSGRRSGPGLKAHRVSAAMAGMDIEGRHVLHSCDNPPCCNPAHLRPGTPADNAMDRVERRRGCHGERNPHAKLTDAQVVEIQRRRQAGERRDRLAAEFGVHGATITRIAKGEGWRHVTGNAVTPPVAEVIVSALVEAVTGEDLAREVVAA